MALDPESNDILKQVRAIEIKSKVLSKEIFSGEYHTAFKGKGMSFSEHREYHHGDDIRDIDWNVTARMRKPYVKLYQEEREITTMMILDVSSSESFGTRLRTKRRLLTELTAVLAFSASSNNDKIGAILFSDRIEKFIPPKKGRSHILRIITEVLRITPEGKGTDVGSAIAYLNQVIKKRSISFLISDFKTGHFETELNLAARRHDLVAMRLFDPIEEDLPNIGVVHLSDLETGDDKWINTSRRSVRSRWNKQAKEHRQLIEGVFQRCQVDHAHLSTKDDYIPRLIQLFRHR